MSQFNEHLKLRISLSLAQVSICGWQRLYTFANREISIPVLMFAPSFDWGKSSGKEARVRDCPLLNNPFRCTKKCSYQGCCWFEIKYFSLEANVHIIFLNCYINLLVFPLKYLMALYSLEDISVPCLVVSIFTSCIYLTSIPPGASFHPNHARLFLAPQASQAQYMCCFRSHSVPPLNYPIFFALQI